MPLYNGDAVDEDAAFDVVRLHSDPGEHHVSDALLYVKADADASVAAGIWAQPVGYLPHQGDYDWDPETPENAEVIRRIRAGTCEVRYGRSYPGTPEHEIFHFDWLLATLTPFGHGRIDQFFEKLAERGRWEPGPPARFYFPGVLADQSNPKTTTRFKRIDQADYSSPVSARYDGDEAAFLQALEAEGWVEYLPPGGDRLYRQVVTYGTRPDGTPFTLSAMPEDIRWAFAAHRDRIRAAARGFARWHNALPGSSFDQDALMMRLWWRTWIGYAWGLLDRDAYRTIFVKPASQDENPTDPSRQITGNLDTANWIIGHLEEWVERGVEGMRPLISENVRTLLGNRVLFKIMSPGGQIGERLATPVGSDDWVSYQTTYDDALGHNVDVVASAGQTVVSGDTVQLSPTVRVLNPVGPTTYAWSRVSGDGGSLDDEAIENPTFTAPVLEPHEVDAVIVWRLEACNDGLCDSGDETVTVLPPIRLVADNLAPSVQAGQIANMQITREGGTSPFTWSVDAAAAPDWVTVLETGVVKLAPGADVAAGTHVVTITVTDSRDVTAEVELTITVTAAP